MACLANLEKAASADYNSAPIACRTRFALRTGSRSRSLTFGTLNRKRKLKRPLASENGLVEINLEPESHIIAAARSIGICRALTRAAEEIIKPERSTAAATAENIAEHGKDIIHIHAASAEAAATAAVCKRLMPKLIVTRALISIMKDVVRLGCLFELFFRLFISRITVWMILHCKLAICRLNFIGSRILGNSKHLVIIALI
jgi:hypothetical protein